MHRAAGQVREVFHRAMGVHAPQHIGRQGAVPNQIMFSSIIHAINSS